MTISTGGRETSRILIVDDDPEELFAMSLILKKAGYHVEECRSGRAALDKAGKFDPDILLVDVVMPEMDGIEVCRRIKSDSRLSRIFVILVSGLKKTPEFQANGLDAGADGFITRPFAAVEFLSRIRSMIRIKAAEDDLRTTQTWLRAALSSIGDAYIAADTSCRILSMNPNAEKLTGWSMQDARLKHLSRIFDIIDPYTGKKLENPIARVLREGSILQLDGQAILISKKGSQVPIADSATAIRDKSGEIVGAVVVFRDISEKIKAEKCLVQAQKMEAIGTLAGGIAHDFNNLLSSIIGFTELSIEDAEPGTIQEENLQQVYRAGKRAKDLVWQILTFTRQTDDPMESIQIDAIAKEALKFISFSIPATIMIKQNFDSDSLIMGNPTQVHQVIMNLCTNAAHAMESLGGTLGVSLKDVKIDKASTMFKQGLKSGEYIELKVSDTGTGIPANIVASIFEPYFTTKAPGEGTGMGLAVSQGIVEKYGGKISVESRIGKGSSFCVYLPITRKRQGRQWRGIEKQPSGTERILFVDDEALIANMGCQVLERLGYKVTTKTSSIEALELFQANPENYDLVITDMTMPEMTGDRLATALMEIRPDIPIILCTGYSKNISDQTALEIGIKAFAYKPMVMADLANTVRKVLNEAKDAKGAQE